MKSRAIEEVKEIQADRYSKPVRFPAIVILLILTISAMALPKAVSASNTGTVYVTNASPGGGGGFIVISSSGIAGSPITISPGNEGGPYTVASGTSVTLSASNLATGWGFSVWSGSVNDNNCPISNGISACGFGTTYSFTVSSGTTSITGIFWGVNGLNPSVGTSYPGGSLSTQISITSGYCASFTVSVPNLPSWLSANVITPTIYFNLQNSAPQGSYQINIQATCNSPSQVAGETVARPYELTVGSLPLQASAQASTFSGPAPLYVQFSGYASGGVTPYYWAWQFQDGPQGTTQNPSHTFNSPGTYHILMTVTDSSQPTPQQSSSGLTISVGEPPDLLTVSAGSGGTTNPSPGQYQHYAGDSISVSYSITGSGYTFAGWTVSGASCNGGSMSNPCTFTMPNQGVAVSATFTQVTSGTVVSFSTTGLSSSASGSVLTVDGTTYSVSQLPMQFTWNVGSSHSFSWYSTVVGGSTVEYVWNSASGLSTQRMDTIVTPSGGGGVTATYSPFYQVAFEVNPSGAGTITPSGGGSAPGSTSTSETAWYYAGTTISISVQPASGNTFQSWSSSTSSISISNPTSTSTSVTINGPGTVTANFSSSTQTLTTTVGSGSGSVNPNCPNGCSETVGSSITVTATPSSRGQFSSWSTQTGVSCSSASCTFNMPNNPVTLSATFTMTTSFAFSISTPSDQSTSQGGSATFSFTVTTTSGSPLPVDLSLMSAIIKSENLELGTLSWSQNPVTPSISGTTVQLTVQVSCGTPLGGGGYDEPLQITGSVGGASASSGTFDLAVKGVSSCPLLNPVLDVLSYTVDYGKTNVATATGACANYLAPDQIIPNSCYSEVSNTVGEVGTTFHVSLTVKNIGTTQVTVPSSLVVEISAPVYVCQTPLSPFTPEPPMCPNGILVETIPPAPVVSPAEDANGNGMGTSAAGGITCTMESSSYGSASLQAGQQTKPPVVYDCSVSQWAYAGSAFPMLLEQLVSIAPDALLHNIPSDVKDLFGELQVLGYVEPSDYQGLTQKQLAYLANNQDGFIVAATYTLSLTSPAEYSQPINVTVTAPHSVYGAVVNYIEKRNLIDLGLTACGSAAIFTGVILDVACDIALSELSSTNYYSTLKAVGESSSATSSCAPSLDLFTPQLSGFTVSVNGVTVPCTPGSSIVSVYWDWGDGIQQLSTFPATHTYSQGGTFTISVTSFQSDELSTTMTTSVTVGSTTTPAQTLTTTINSGSGSISPSCPAGCGETVGSSLTITASPSSGWQFSSWSTQNGISCSSASCIFSMPNNPVTLKATFSQVTQTLITKVASGSGAVSPYYPTGSPVGVGARVSVSAYPTSSGWQFSSWSVSGASCSGSPTSSPCSFTMPNNPVTLSAYFITTPSPFGFSISVSPGSGTVQAGKASAGTVVLTLTSGSSQSVSLSETGLPGNVGTLSFTSTSCLPTCTSSLIVGTFPGAPAGIYSITITATGGRNTHSTTYTLTVTSGFDFSLSNSGGITVAQGSSNSNTITVTSSPFTSGAITTTQPVSLSCTSGLPLGSSCRFNPTSGSPTFSSTLTISASASTPVGTYLVTVTGVGSGKTHTTQFTLTVSSPSFDFSIGVSPASGIVQAGGTSTASVTLTLSSGSSQSVSLSETGLPRNVGTVSYNSPSCSPTCTASFSIGTFSGAPAGTYTIAISGTGGGKTHSTTYRLTVSSIAGVENLVTLNSGLSVTEPLLNCENPTTTHCFSVQQNIAVQVSGSSGEYTYWAQNVINVQQNVFGQWEAAAAFNVFNSANKIVACQPGIPPACTTGLGFTSFTLPITITMTSVISGNSVVMTSNFGSFTFKLGSGSGNIIYTSSPYPYLNPELAIVGDRSGHQATFGSGTSGQVQSFLLPSSGAWQNASAQTLLSTSNTQTGETAVNLSWTISSGNVARFAYKKGASGEGICFWHL